MTFKTTVTDGATGKPVQGAYVEANINNNGHSYTRFTDGNGYADVAVLRDDGKPTAAGLEVTFVVECDGYRRNSQYLLTTTTDQTIGVVLVPFDAP